MNKRLLLIVALICFGAGASVAQESTIVKGTLNAAETDRIMKKVTENESNFRYALTNYVFNRDATVQTVGMGGQITGSYHRESFMSLNADGRRMEKILRFPISTLKEIGVTPEDLEDLGGVNPFALEPSMVAQYNFTYLGKEKIDELDLLVIEVTPKVIPDPKKSKLRLFTGRIWVDERDLMIVKSKGKAVPETKQNKFPIVETWRENVDGKFWFPSFSKSDDEIVFDSGQVVKLRIRVKYTDYRQGRSDVKVLEEPEEEAPKPAATPAPVKKP